MKGIFYAVLKKFAEPPLDLWFLHLKLSDDSAVGKI
jgi:hypothetical protein